MEKKKNNHLKSQVLLGIVLAQAVITMLLMGRAVRRAERAWRE